MVASRLKFVDITKTMAFHRHPTNPRVLGTNNSSAVTALVMMPCVKACWMSSSITLRLGAMP
jgi:hypothetical protein